MEVALSIVAGLGLRLFLASATGAGPSNKLTTSLLGFWEGVVVHQVSGRSNSPKLDHLLAYGLRLVIDLLVLKDIQRMVLVVLCSGLAAIVSESLVPYAALRSAIRKEREREKPKERRQRPSRSDPLGVPIISIPLPPRIRAYRPPDIPATSTPAPLQPLSPFPPKTPPSFYLHEHEASAVYSPPKPVQVSVVDKPSSPDSLPVRPRSGVAAILDDSGSSPPLQIPLPTPPESAQSTVPSESNDPQKSRFERQLYTIPELSSPEDGSPPTERQQHEKAPPLESQPAHTSASTANVPLPVPNNDMRRLPSSHLDQWFTAQYSATNNANADAIFAHPFSPTLSPPGPAPLPVRIRHQGSSEPTPQQLNHPIDEGNDYPPDANGSVIHEEDDINDPMRTPPAHNHGLLWMEDDLDPLQTPQHLQPPEATELLSPLVLDVKSDLDSQSDPQRETTPIQEEPQSATVHNIPGSLSQNTLLHPPLPPSGPLIRRPTSPPDDTPPPPSPALSSNSGQSAISVLSTRIPNKLYSKGDELRQKAREEEKTRTQIEAERKKAENEGRSIEALSLKIKIRELETEAQKLHEKAARRYYAARNSVEISNKIDVHGLRPREAFERIERTIVKASSEGKNVVRVIVGKGLHSANQQPTLKPAVQREMQRLNLPCEVDSRNPGVLNITIPVQPSSGITM